MKLIHQINLAFALSLVLVLSVTGVVIHFVLMDHFIGAQRQDLKSISAAMTQTLVQTALPVSPLTVANTAEGAQAIPVTMPAYAGVEAIVADSEGNIVRGSLPLFAQAGTVEQHLEAAEPASGSVSLQRIWDGTDARFIAEVSPLPTGTLTLITPLSRIQSIERALLGRLLIIFAVGGGLMVLVSLLFTKKLIHPLMRLKDELQKVKGRHFSQVRLVKAGGEIGSVAQAVYEMAGELNRYNHVQKQFFQNASHELKTPLMSISGYAEGIRDGVFEGEGVNKGLDIIVSECSRLKKLVTEMTLLAKLDSEEDVFRLGPVCLKDLLTETVERVNPLLTARGITISIVCNPPESLLVHADRDKLLQALLNVVSNGVRYAKGQILIQAGMNRGRVEVTVSDDGPGIEEELLPYLFHRFIKGKDGESGLGLAISRAIIERCGGLITANNRQEGGAVIRMGFPVSA